MKYEMKNVLLVVGVLTLILLTFSWQALTPQSQIPTKQERDNYEFWRNSVKYYLLALGLGLMGCYFKDNKKRRRGSSFNFS